MLIGHGKSREFIVLKPIYDALGCPLASALIVFHSFTTGCDTVGRFSGKGKITCSGIHWSWTGRHTIWSNNLSIKTLYLSIVFTWTSNEDPGSVRCLLFKKNKAECENLPPTKAAPAHTLCQLPSQNMASGSHRESHTCLSDRTWMEKRRWLALSCENITKTSSRCCDWAHKWQMCEI